MRNLMLILALVTAVAFSAFASNVKSGDKVTIDQPVQGNLYVAAGKIAINAAINSDLVAAGGEILINDRINEDALLCGGEIDVDAIVGGDLRLIGGEINIRKDIMGDLVVTGGEVTVMDGVTIYGDLLVGGGSIFINGTVKGNIKVAGGEITLKGIAEGNVEVRGGEIYIDAEVGGMTTLSAGEINIGKQARFKNNVKYWQKEGELNFGDRLSEGATASFQPELKVKFFDYNWRYLGFGFAAFMLYRLFAAAALIVLIVLLFNRNFVKNAGLVKKGFANYLAYGAIALVGVPIAAGLACVTIIGIPAGILLLTLYGMVAALGHVIMSVVAAYELKEHAAGDWGKGRLMVVSIGLFFVLKIIGMVPVVGGIVSLVVLLAAFGYIVQSVRKSKNEDAEVEPEPDTDTV